MIKKESVRQLIIEVIHKKVEDQLCTLGFKYLKSKNQFTKSIDKYKQIISISYYNASIEYDENKDQIQLNFNISSGIEILKLEKWCQNEYGQKHRLYHGINSFNYFYNLSDSELSLLKIYSPTKSQQFKANVTRVIKGKSKQEVISFDEIEKYGFKLFVSNLELFCNAKLIYDNRRSENDLSYIRMLEFLGEFDLAREENIKNLEFWRKGIEKADFKAISDKKIALVNFNKRTNLINHRFSTDLKTLNENFKPFEINLKNTNIIHGKDVVLSLALSLINPSSKILKYHKIGKYFFQIRENGTILKHDIEGNILETMETALFDKLNPHNINISHDESILFVGDIAITENDYTSLVFKSNLKNNGLIIPVPYSQVYLPKRKEYAFLVSNHKKHEIHFCSEDGASTNIQELSEKPIEIIPQIEIILCENEDKSCEVYSLDGNYKYSMPTNNARYSFKRHYDYNLKGDLFLSGWNYTKSQLYKLSTGIFLKQLWAHPTYIKDYKEKLYSDINQSFGMSNFKFSPNGDYIIGGAEHGKYVGWTTHDYNRIELIPDKSYLKRLVNAEIVEIEGNKMLKNRGNHMWNILFFEDGIYFGFQVDKDLLIWDQNFKHIDTIIDLGYVSQIDKNYFLVNKLENYEIFEVCTVTNKP